MGRLIFLAALTLPAAPAPVAVPGLPEPPQQRRPWTPPQSGVPDEFVTAAAKLFEVGLADPRGCQYRAVTVQGPRLGDSADEPVKTHAWVLPATAGGWRYAVCWDGLVYPILGIGPAADLAADVRAAEAWHVDYRKPKNPNDGKRYVEINREKRTSLRHDGWLGDTATALLLRLGRGEEATRLWTASRPSDRAEAGDDPYLALAREWTWRSFERGLAAHLRADDWTARSSLKPLAGALPAIEADAGRRGWKPGGKAGNRFPGFLDQLPHILTDQERRVAAPPRQPVVCVGPGRHPDPAVRVAALIDRLDEASVQHMFQYFLGGGHWNRDPVVRSLADEGDAAIEALL
jgi:hypothetical protein